MPVSGYARIGEDFRVDRVLQAACIRVSETGYSLTPGVEPPQPEQEKAPRRYSPGGTIIQNSGTETFEEKAAGEKTAKALRLDRPFIFMVWEENTDTIVLAGQFTGKAK